jgi:branched-subunit amino acid transport protein AzlD
MNNSIKVGVYRRLDNRLEGLPDNSPLALELHNRRKVALHEVFDDQTAISVLNWGNTDDSKPHEYVEIIITALSAQLMGPIVISALKELGMVLVEKAVDEITSATIKWVISKLIKKQEEKKIQDFTIVLKDGTFIRVDPPQGKSKITINFSDSGITSIKYKSKMPNPEK